MNLTSHERIMRIIRGEPVDRPAVKLWGVEPGQHLLHPDYQAVYDLAIEKTDLFCGAGSPFDFITGNASYRYETANRPISSEWNDVEIIVHTPEGDLTKINRISTTGKPGYTKSYFIKERDDLKKILSIPYEPYPVSLESYDERDRAVGQRGIVTFCLDHPGYALQRLMGSELLALMSVDERELLKEVISVFSGRLKEFVKTALDAGLSERGKKDGFVMAWVGPELLIPPLLSFTDFEEFCFAIYKPLMDTIHDSGGNIWIHSHGKMAHLIKRFADMGCDVLNPIEPPPMGDLTLEDAFKEAAGRLSLEGNIEIHEIMQSSEKRLQEIIEEAIMVGARHGRFILCPSTGYMEVPQPSPVMIQNLLTYVKFGLFCAEKYHY